MDSSHDDYRGPAQIRDAHIYNSAAHTRAHN